MIKSKFERKLTKLSVRRSHVFWVIQSLLYRDVHNSHEVQQLILGFLGASMLPQRFP